MLYIKEGIRSRLTDSIETSAKLADGLTIVNVLDKKQDILFSQNFACPEHGISVDKLTPRMFSFNNPYGACKKCTGLGVFMRIDPDIILPNKNLTLNEGAIRATGWSSLDNYS